MDSLHERMILGEELLPLIRDRLEAGQSVRYLPFRGVSMLPMLRQGKDSVELSPLPERLKKYDLPVYQYPSGKIVMHRVVAVREDHYICLGDNTYEYETIYPRQLIALVSAFKRGDRRISVDARSYRIYARLWVASYPLRKFLKKAKHRLKGILKKI
ncbi:MAG: S24/S26 family peptidase [Oscillospiraceae bacterium]|nr:S24/S26 family peptidase [Oscillospiraceae bacterium]